MKNTKTSLIDKTLLIARTRLHFSLKKKTKLWLAAWLGDERKSLCLELYPKHCILSD
jgi:hypothetical protein